MNILYKAHEVINAVNRMSSDIKNKIPDTSEIELIPILMGAMYLTVDLSRNLVESRISQFIKINTFSDNNERLTGPKVNIFIDKSLSNISTKNVILVDDYCDSGFTLDYVKSEIVKLLPNCNVFTAVMLLKDECNFTPDFYGLKIPRGSGFLYGYGLDVSNKFRGNLEIMEL